MPSTLCDVAGCDAGVFCALLQVPEQILGGRSYHAADVHQWTADVSALCLKNLKGVANGSAGFKYIGVYRIMLLHVFIK